MIPENKTKRDVLLVFGTSVELERSVSHVEVHCSNNGKKGGFCSRSRGHRSISVETRNKRGAHCEIMVYQCPYLVVLFNSISAQVSESSHSGVITPT